MTSASRKGPALFTLRREGPDPMSARPRELALTLSLSAAAKSKLTCHPERGFLREGSQPPRLASQLRSRRPEHSEGSAFFPLAQASPAGLLSTLSFSLCIFLPLIPDPSQKSLSQPCVIPVQYSRLAASCSNVRAQ